MATAVVSQHLQDNFVYLILTDDKFIKYVRVNVLPEFFGDKVTTDLIKAA